VLFGRRARQRIYGNAGNTDWHVREIVSIVEFNVNNKVQLCVSRRRAAHLHVCVFQTAMLGVEIVRRRCHVASIAVLKTQRRVAIRNREL